MKHSNDWTFVDRLPEASIWREEETGEVKVSLYRLTDPNERPAPEGRFWSLTQGEAARLGRALLRASGFER